jgi:hypothetical protein
MIEDTLGVGCLAMLVDKDRILYQEIGLLMGRLYLDSKVWMVDDLCGIGLNTLGSIDFLEGDELVIFVVLRVYYGRSSVTFYSELGSLWQEQCYPLIFDFGSLW